MDAARTDILALRRLVHLYCHRIDNGTAEAIADLFLPDGVLHLAFLPRRRDQTGWAEIARWFVGYMATTRRESVHNRHRVGALSLQVGEAGATATTWWDASGIRRATGVLHLLRGHYIDVFARHRGGWGFARREIHLMDEIGIPDARRFRPEAPPPRHCTAAWTAHSPEP
jgi:hypothetical protein